MPYVLEQRGIVQVRPVPGSSSQGYLVSVHVQAGEQLLEELHTRLKHGTDEGEVQVLAPNRSWVMDVRVVSVGHVHCRGQGCVLIQVHRVVEEVQRGVL